jgi:hypothetical protein
MTIYFNKLTGNSLTIYILMGVTYLLLGADRLLYGWTLQGIILIIPALIALSLILAGLIPRFANSAFIRVDHSGLSWKEGLTATLKSFGWEQIKEVSLDKRKLYLTDQTGKKFTLRLSGLNENEKKWLKKLLEEHPDSKSKEG